MDKGQRNILSNFKPTFVNNVDQIDNLLDELEGNNVLADAAIESIREIPSRQEKARKILYHLAKRPPSAFDKFYNCLIESENEDLADKLKPECAPCRRVRKKKPSAGSRPGLSHSVQPVDERDHGKDDGVGFPVAEAAEESLVEEDLLPKEWPDPNRSLLNMYVKEVEAQNVRELFEIQKSGQFTGGYKMTSNPRGRAVILNNTKFDSSPKGTNNDADMNAIKKILEAFRYSVDTWHNYTQQELLHALDRESKHENHWNTDSFVMIIMSKGVKGAIKTTDEREFTIEDILAPFNRDRCPALVGKPKMFFVQACQGITQDSGDQTDSTAEVTTGVENMKISDGKAVTDAGAEKVPLFADFIVVNATTPNFVSYRNGESGSWFIQALFEVFSVYSNKEHLLDILVKVNNLVARGKTQRSGKMQISNISFNTLRHKVYFFPGLPALQQQPSGGNLFDLGP